MAKFLSMAVMAFARRAAALMLAGGLASLAGCTALTAGQLVQAGYDAAKTSLTAPMSGDQARHARLVMNSMSVGQEVAPILTSMGVPPQEKSGNAQGFVCYQYAGVYTSTEDAVIMAKDGKVVFFGSSTCRAEMQSANFAAGGKYADVGHSSPGSAPAASSSSSQSPAPSSSDGDDAAAAPPASAPPASAPPASAPPASAATPAAPAPH